MASVGGDSVASRVSEQRLRRQEMQRQVESLRNRINALKVEETRSLKKTREIEHKTQEVVAARERHARELSLRVEQQNQKTREQAEMRERVQKFKDEQKLRACDLQQTCRQQKSQFYVQTKADETEAARLRAEIAELEKSRGIALKQKLKAEAEALKARRETEKLARLLEARKRTEEKLKEEEEETRKLQDMVSQLTEQETLLVQQVTETQKYENSAFLQFEQLLGSCTPVVARPVSPRLSVRRPEEPKQSWTARNASQSRYVTATGRVIELEDSDRTLRL